MDFENDPAALFYWSGPRSPAFVQIGGMILQTDAGKLPTGVDAAIMHGFLTGD
jgi:hypothetical protein